VTKIANKFLELSSHAYLGFRVWKTEQEAFLTHLKLGKEGLFLLFIDLFWITRKMWIFLLVIAWVSARWIYIVFQVLGENLSSFLPLFLSSFLTFFLSSFLLFFLSSFLPFFLSSLISAIYALHQLERALRVECSVAIKVQFGWTWTGRHWTGSTVFNQWISFRVVCFLQWAD